MLRLLLVAPALARLGEDDSMGKAPAPPMGKAKALGHRNLSRAALLADAFDEAVYQAVSSVAKGGGEGKIDKSKISEYMKALGQSMDDKEFGDLVKVAVSHGAQVQAADSLTDDEFVGLMRAKYFAPRHAKIADNTDLQRIVSEYEAEASKIFETAADKDTTINFEKTADAVKKNLGLNAGSGDDKQVLDAAFKALAKDGKVDKKSFVEIMQGMAL
jgi:hypothetical protein